MKECIETEYDGCWSRLPVYRPGGRLTAEQLESEQKDADLRERLLSLALHGTGVVHGFDIKTDNSGNVLVEDGCITIGCGLALDRYGRTLFTSDRQLSMRDLMTPMPTSEGCYTLRVHYAERMDRADWDPCEDVVAWKYRCVVFSLKKECKPACKCPECLPDPSCAPRHTFVCERTGMISNGDFESPELKTACCKEGDLTHCKSHYYDPNAGIPLACLKICQINRDDAGCDPIFGFCECGQTPYEPDDCDDAEEHPERQSSRNPAAQEAVRPSLEVAEGRAGKRMDDCSSPTSCEIRPVVYRSPLLYELINDTDVYLPKVSDYSWKDSALGPWQDDHRMSMEEFMRRVEDCTFNDSEVCPSGVGTDDGFYVAFDRPVKVDTLHPLSVLMEVYLRENRTNSKGKAMVVNWTHYRVPLLIKPDTVEGDDTCAVGFHICISEAWLAYIIGDIRACSADGQLARVEITLRGQMIRDKCGCMLDAVPPELTCRDRCGRKTGQARPGGDWISVFRVGPDFPADDYDTDEADQSTTYDGGRVGGFATSRNGEQS